MLFKLKRKRSNLCIFYVPPKIRSQKTFKELLWENERGRGGEEGG